MQNNYMEKKNACCSPQLLQTETWIGKLDMCLNKPLLYIVDNIHLPRGDIMPFEWLNASCLTSNSFSRGVHPFCGSQSHMFVFSILGC